MSLGDLWGHLPFLCPIYNHIHVPVVASSYVGTTSPSCHDHDDGMPGAHHPRLGRPCFLRYDALHFCAFNFISVGSRIVSRFNLEWR